MKNSTVFHSSSAFFFSRYLKDERRWALARSVSGRANLTWKKTKHKTLFSYQFHTKCKYIYNIHAFSCWLMLTINSNCRKTVKISFSKKMTNVNQSLHQIFKDKYWVQTNSGSGKDVNSSILAYMVRQPIGMNWWFISLKCSVTLFFLNLVYVDVPFTLPCIWVSLRTGHIFLK